MGEIQRLGDNFPQDMLKQDIVLDYFDNFERLNLIKEKNLKKKNDKTLYSKNDYDQIFSLSCLVCGIYVNNFKFWFLLK